MSLPDSFPLPADDDIVLVPAEPRHRAGRPDEIDLDLRQLAATGEPVALVFTDTAALVRTLGPYQPWIGLPMADLADRLRDAGVANLQINPTYAAPVAQWTERDLDDAAGEQ